MSLFTNDIETVHEGFGWGTMMLADAIFRGGMAIFKMFQVDWLMTLLSLIPMLCLLAVSLIVGKYMMKKWERRQRAFSDISDFAQESFSGIAVIKAYVKEGKELWKFKRLNEQNEDANVDHTKAATLLHVFVTLFVESVICVILGYGGFLVYNKTFTPGEFVEFIGYFTLIVWPIMAISQLIEMQSRGKASLNRISELLDTEIEVCDREDACDVDIKGKIEFKGLTFKYPGTDICVLDNVSFTVNVGERVGIVGKTGSGKTTLVDLILRTYNVPDDTILVDGVCINKISISNLRSHFA